MPRPGPERWRPRAPVRLFLAGRGGNLNDTASSLVRAAQQAVLPHTWRTPLLPSAGLSLLSGARVYLKLECWQRTGSFKVRGALFKLARLAADHPGIRVVTASAGNHGLGVAHAASVLGLPPATIVVPENASPLKVDRLRATDCHLVQAGADYDAAHLLAEAYARDRGATYVSAYDDPDVIAGQGTVGLEVLDELPEASVWLVPVGGGGLLAGLALATAAHQPRIRLVGVQPEASPAAHLSLRDGWAHEVFPAGPTICDGLAGGFGRLPFDLVRDRVEEVLVVPEADVRQAVGWLLTHEQLVVEGSGAIAVAPLLTGRLHAPGECIVAILTGRNLHPALLRAILEETAAT